MHAYNFLINFWLVKNPTDLVWFGGLFRVKYTILFLDFNIFGTVKIFFWFLNRF